MRVFFIRATCFASLAEPTPRHFSSPTTIPVKNPFPSTEDREITRNIMKAAEILAIPVLDHLIVTDREIFSFLEYRLDALDQRISSPYVLSFRAPCPKSLLDGS